MNVKLALEKTKEALKLLSDYEDEYLHWAIPVLEERFREILTSFRSVLKGNKELMIKMRDNKKFKGKI